MTSLGKQIQEARKKANMTQAELAEEMKVSAEDVAAWEKDEKTPDRKLLQKMGDSLGTVFFDANLEAQRDSDAKLEKVKAEEFKGKKNVLDGNASQQQGGMKTLLISLAVALAAAAAVYLMLSPQISNLTTQVSNLKQTLAIMDDDVDDQFNGLKKTVAWKDDLDTVQKRLDGEGTLFTAQGKQVQFSGAAGTLMSVLPCETEAQEVTVTVCGENWASVTRKGVSFEQDETDLTMVIDKDGWFTITGKSQKSHMVMMNPSASPRTNRPVLFTLYANNTYYISACGLIYYDETGKTQLIKDGMDIPGAANAAVFVPAQDIQVRGIYFQIQQDIEYSGDVVWEPYVGLTRPDAWTPYSGKTYTWKPGQEKLTLNAQQGVNTVFADTGADVIVYGNRTELDQIITDLQEIRQSMDGRKTQGSLIRFESSAGTQLIVHPETQTEDGFSVILFGENWAGISRKGVTFNEKEPELRFLLLADKRFTVSGTAAANHKVALTPADAAKADSPVLFTLKAGKTYYISACTLVWFDDAGNAQVIRDGMDTPYAKDAVAFIPEQDIQVRGIRFDIRKDTVYSADVVWEPYVGLTRPEGWAAYTGQAYSFEPGQKLAVMKALQGVNTLFASDGSELILQSLEPIRTIDVE